MLKSLLLLPALLLGALPAEAHRGHRSYPQPGYYQPRYKVVCDAHGCVVKFKEPKIRVSEHCVYRPWRDRTICRY